MSDIHRETNKSLVVSKDRSVVEFRSIEIFNRLSGDAIDYAIALAIQDDEQANRLYDAGEVFISKGEIKKAIENFQMAAHSGLLRAQFRLAHIYLEGIGGTVNYAAAHKWFMRAADQGNSDAQLKLGWMYETGLGVEANDKRAIYWYRISAESGNMEAQFNIGVKYDNGEGVEHNPQEAVRWFLMSAEQGFADARYFLAQALERGDGIDQDVQEALDWYYLASEQGHASSRRRFWALCEAEVFKPETYAEAIFCELIGRSLDKSTLTFRSFFMMKDDYENQVYEEIIRAANGSTLAQFSLGFQYVKGEKVFKNEDAAFYWYNLAADKGHSGALNNLGTIHGNRKSKYFDLNRATECYKKSASFESEVGIYNYAIRVINGLGTRKNIKQGIKLLIKSAELGFSSAMERLGDIYYGGVVVPSNYSLALKWFRDAADQKNMGGFYGLEVLYGHGLGVEKDIIKANGFFTTAAESSSYYANKLSEFYAKGVIFSVDLNEAQRWKDLAKSIDNQNEPDEETVLLPSQYGNGLRQMRLREKRRKEKLISSRE